MPEWIKDAKFGVYTHWGVYSVPAHETNIYGQEMYVPKGADRLPRRGRAVRDHHEKTYGSIFEFGYKDFVPMFTAPRFDPAEWAEVMAAGGAKFGGICLVHHDGYCLWDSEFTRWNSMDTGPKRDIYGELAPKSVNAACTCSPPSTTPAPTDTTRSSPTSSPTRRRRGSTCSTPPTTTSTATLRP